MSYWWMSFCDPERPEGTRFLGALVIYACNETEAIEKSHLLKLNPGGEVMFFEIPRKYEYRIPIEWIDCKLLSREECDEFDKKWSN